MQRIRFTYPEDFTDEKLIQEYRLLCFSTPELMGEWKKNHLTGISQNEMMGYDGTYELLGRVKSNRPIGMPVIRYLNDEDGVAFLDIHNGRHRTKLCSEWLGVKTLPALVPVEQADMFLEKNLARAPTHIEIRAINRKNYFPTQNAQESDVYDRY